MGQRDPYSTNGSVHFALQARKHADTAAQETDHGKHAAGREAASLYLAAVYTETGDAEIISNLADIATHHLYGK